MVGVAPESQRLTAWISSSPAGRPIKRVQSQPDKHGHRSRDNVKPPISPSSRKRVTPGKEYRAQQRFRGEHITGDYGRQGISNRENRPVETSAD